MVNAYGAIVSLGIGVGAWIAGRASKRKEIWDVLPWIVIPGVIGARAYHVIDWWEYYRQHLWLVPVVWTGGLGIYGGVAGGVVGLWLWCKKNGQKLGEWLDIAAVGLPLGQAIGRGGNYFNQELYGKATSLPWAIYIKAEDGYFHPLFLYESLWNLFVFGVMWRLRRMRGVFIVYLGLYGLGRFGLEGLRMENWWVNKIISLGLVMVSLGWLWKRNGKGLRFS